MASMRDVVGVFPVHPAIVVAAKAGFAVSIALVHLREAARIGLPPRGRTTRLKTTGVYALSRNPVYVGVLLACIASCAYVPHWVNISATFVTAIGHHYIVLAEERFLRDRFRAEWQNYRAVVRRYV